MFFGFAFRSLALWTFLGGFSEENRKPDADVRWVFSSSVVLYPGDPAGNFPLENCDFWVLKLDVIEFIIKTFGIKKKHNLHPSSWHGTRTCTTNHEPRPWTFKARLLLLIFF